MENVRLIDANLVEKMLWHRLYKNKNAYDNCKNGLDKIPTAYDIDKVVEKLEENQTITFHLDGKSPTQTIELKDAIEIVKAGINYDNK